ncbi:uncharacterized protein LOC119732139 isoform X2 [Patiria miniata]|uniref:Uncharacterized protein n=1 Tax=Patiria miniata TaxID=46514 RepID=A0A914ADA8_PATMI|nr:uncharacterized protein LOC119732139 isoform X2 [Patiria miniata]
MAASVAVTKVPATQPSNQKPAVHDGKTDSNSPVPSSDLTSGPSSPTTTPDMMSENTSAISGSQQDDLDHSRGGSSGPPVHSGKSASPREDVGKNDSALPNGDYNSSQTGSASNSITSCYCPEGPRSRPVPPHKNPRPTPRKPQPRATPPKLPPKPPHLLQLRSPSSDNLMGRSNRDKDPQGRDKRSQSVSVVGAHNSPPREDVQATKPFKHPIPTPRKSLPNLFQDLSSADIKSLEQSGTRVGAQKQNSKMTASSSEASYPKSPSHQRGEPLSPNSQSGPSSPVNRQEMGRKKTKTTQHVRVRERAAIFEKLIEVETSRNRDSQISEPRSRTSSRASDVNETSVIPKLSNTSGSMSRSRDKHHSYVNIELHDNTVLPENVSPRTDASAEDETVSVASVSSDDLFMSPQSSIKNRPRRPPSPNLSEDEHTEDSRISNRRSSFTYTDVVLPNESTFKKTEESSVSQRDTEDTYIVTTDSDAGDSGYTDVVIPDSVSSQNIQKSNVSQSNSNIIIIPKSNANTQDDDGVPDSKLLQDSEKSETSYSESDYTDVVVPEWRTSHDFVSPEVALDVAEPPPKSPKPRFSLPIELESASQPERHDMLSPDHALPKPFHSAHTYRNVTPLFVMPARQTRASDKAGVKRETDSAERRPTCQQGDDVTVQETDNDQEGIQMELADNFGSSASLPQEAQSKGSQQQTDQEPISEDTEETAEASDMLPESRRREKRIKSHPAERSMLYEVCLPDFINPITLQRKDGIEEPGQISPTTKNEVDESQGESSEVVEDAYFELAEARTQELPDTEQHLEGEGSDMLCNRSRRQRFAVKKRDSNAAGRGRNKWQHESAPATLGGLERQEAITELPTEVTSPLDGNNRLSQASSAGSAISSLISNVSIGDADQLSSDEEDYEDVQAPPSDAPGADVVPPLASPTKHMDGKDTRPLPCEDIGEDDTYSTLYEVRASGPVRHEDNDVLPQRGSEDNEELSTKDEEQDRVPVEIEMQPMKLKSPHSTDKESRRKAFEFHMPLFLRKSSSVESTMSGHYSDNRSSRSLTTHSEDSDASSDYLEELPSVAQQRNRDARDSSASEDGVSVRSGNRVSMDSLNLSVQSELQDNLRRRRRKSSERGRPASEYDRPASAASMEYDRPVSIASSEYDRPISSSSADYIGVLNSFHKDGKRDEDSEGFSLTWNVDHGEDDRYRPKSEELPQTTPAKYALPRKGSNAAKPVPALPTAYKALKPPKAPRPYSEPSPQKTKRNSLVKILPVPSKEEITEQFSKMSRQRSRFVSQEPLFQIYQEDARSRESYLRLMNVSSLESLAKFLENQEALKKEKRESESIPTPSQLPEYRVLMSDEEMYRYQSGEECKSGDVQNKDINRASRSGEEQGEAVYQSVEPIYEPPGELYYDTGNILQNNTIYESGSLGSSTGEGSGGSSSDVDIPKPYGLMERTKVSSAVRRSFWSELPEVISSGLLEQMTQEEKRLQEALFEVITSEASYLRSLNLVVEHFLEDPKLQPPADLLKKAQDSEDQVKLPEVELNKIMPAGGQLNKEQALKGQQPAKGLLNKVQHHLLFSNIKSVRDASERLLLDLEERLKDSTIISDVCDLLLQHFEKGGFNSYIVYCANHQYQIKILEELRKNPLFLEVIKDLESKPACCSLDLQSFLMLPFQRITRLPLLIEAIRQQTKLHDPLHSTALEALKALRNMAEKCNEEAKRMEMIEEVTQLANQLDFREGVKKMNLSGTTSIVKRGRLHIIKKDNKLLTRGKLIAKAIYVIVFTDKVAICKQKMKGEQLKYDVFDWCPRNRVQVEAVDNPQQHPKLPDGVPNNCKHVFIISFLENSQKKEVVFAVDANSVAERERWMDAMHPVKKTEDGETIYESWDCPQVLCNQAYEAQDRDELSLDVHDRVDIDKKIDGWYYGTRVSDHAKGWFPANHTQEIINDHVLARNLKQRHRLLSMCDQHLWKAKNMRK